MIKITVMYGTDVFVEFKFNKNLVEIIKEIPVRIWNPEEKVWWFPIAYLDKFLKMINGHSYEIKNIDRMKNEDEAKKFSFKTPPYNHQLEGFEFGKKWDRFLLGDEQGLGKTKQAIDIAEYKKLLYGYQHTLIICGIKTLTHNWIQEIRVHSNSSGVILGYRKAKGNKEKLQDLENIDSLPYFLVTNVETLRSKELLSKIKDLIEKDKIGMVIFDEFHKVKNPESQQGKALLELKPFTRIALTGTPLMNSPLDLYTVLNWLGIEQHNFYQFKQHYCELGKFKEIIGFKNLDELNTILQSTMLRRKKNQVLDLPPKIYTTEYLEMSSEQEKIYEEVRTQLIENIDKIILSKNPLTELIRLRQATGFTGILSENIRVSVKFDRAFEIVDEVIENGSKVLIFSQWTDILNPLYKAMEAEGYNPALITGDVKDKEKEKLKFMEDDSCKVLLGSIASMGVGLTLTKAGTVVFLDEPWNKATKEQAEDRAHRIGTEGTVNIITLICKNTIDEAIEEVVYMKGRLSDAIVDGEIKTTDRKGLLRKLLNI